MTPLTDLLRRAALPACLLLTACGGGGGSSATGSGGTVGAGSVSTPPAVSWYSTARPLIERYCVACHTEGGVAPFPLQTHSQVVAKRSAMVYVLEGDTMPPQGYANLLPGETGLLLDWLNAGAPLGDPPRRRCASWPTVLPTTPTPGPSLKKSASAATSRAVSPPSRWKRMSR